MSNGDLYPKGKKLWHKGIDSLVEYVCHVSNDVHIVLAEACDCLDDRIREVRSDQLLEEAVPTITAGDFLQTDPECREWVRLNQVDLYRSYHRALGRLEGQGYLPPDTGTHDGGFLFYALFRYEESRLKAQLAPGSRTRQ